MMDLLQYLKHIRAKPREPFPRTAFTVVSALVREYKLDERFLQNLRDFSLEGADWLSGEPRAKEPFTPPLFSLVPRAEYRVTQAILAAADNPYLRFAHSPGELMLAKSLHRFNPVLKPAILARIHFHTLLTREIVRNEIKDLRRCLEEDLAPVAESQKSADHVRLASLERRLNRLNKFIDQSMSNLQEQVGSNT